MVVYSEVMEKNNLHEPGVYTVKMMARLTGVAPDTLRAWERRYGAIAPSRRESGHRLYSEADVVRLKLLRQVTESGHAIGRVATLSEEVLRGLVAKTPVVSTEPTLVDQVLEAVLRFDPVTADGILTRAAALLAPNRLMYEVVVPLLQAVGDRWAAGELTVAHEHLISAQLRSLLGTLIRMSAPRPDAPGILLATLPSERHELGLLLVALLAASRRLPVCYLGPDMPVDDIVLAAHRLGVAVVGVSLVRVENPVTTLKSLKTLAKSVAPAVLWVGGAGAASLPAAGWPVGAKRFGSLEEAEAALEGLGSERR